MCINQKLVNAEKSTSAVFFSYFLGSFFSILSVLDMPANAAKFANGSNLADFFSSIFLASDPFISC